MNLKKVIICLATIILLINIIFIPKTFAFSSIIESGDGFIGAAELEEEVIDEGKVKEVSSKIYNILLVCGIGVAVIVGAVLGVSFIISSAEGKAKIAETLVPYIVGCFVVFGAFGIWSTVINIGNKLFEDSEQLGMKAVEVYNNGKISSLSDKEVIEIYNSLKEYDGEDEVDTGLYNYFQDGVIKIIYDNKSIDDLSDTELINYFNRLKQYGREDEVDADLYNYYREEINDRGIDI